MANYTIQGHHLEGTITRILYTEKTTELRKKEGGAFKNSEGSIL